MKKLVITTKDGKKHIIIVGSVEEFKKFVDSLKKEK
jgi:hypothetical protein